jgi:hypothetical protein
LFIYHKELVHRTLFVYIYVDDIIITGSSSTAIIAIIQYLQVDFAINDLRQLNLFLGVEALHDTTGLYLLQQHYVINVLVRSGMLGIL